MPRKKGSPFLTTPTVVILPAARASLGEFKFTARAEFPKEHIVSIEGRLDMPYVFIEEFIANIEYTATNRTIDYAAEAITRAKQAAAGRKRQWLGTIHSHPYPPEFAMINDMSPTDHESGHFYAEVISAIYTIKKSGKNSRLYSPPIRYFVPAGRIEVISYSEPSSE